MYKLSDKTLKSRDYFYLKEFGVPWSKVQQLDDESQQKLILESRKIKSQNESDYVYVNIGSGEHSTFIKVKKGKRVMLADGTFIIAKPPLEESRRMDSRGRIIENSKSEKRKVLSLFK